MATVLLGTLGGALGGAIGGPFGAMAGRALGAMAGSYVDQQIVNALTPPTRREGPRLTTSDIQTATEGMAIDRAYGRARLTGQIIWATRYEEQVVTQQLGGKGAPTPKVITTDYSYYANFALGLCEGEVAAFGRIWADGKEIDQTQFTIRYYRGTETQGVDPLIEAKEGVAPAYRGLAYVVFDRLPIGGWGNRLPQISVEVFRAVGELEPLVQGVAIIGTNEFGCDTEAVTVTDGPSENRHNLIAATDWTASIDRLVALAPNLKSVMLVVPWFGDDLRAGSCTIAPRVDSAGKPTKPFEWAVAGLTRSSATVVSMVDGKPAYGGSPNDASTIRAIKDLKARGIAVTVCPFVMMDVPAANGKPNPYSNNASGVGQAVYPWRGRITVSPAPGFAGSPDKTATAQTQITAFMGTAAASHFAAIGDAVVYSGPVEWRYRRFVLHCAMLAKMAGGVETMLIGSEMVGLSTVRSNGSTYPFVNALRTLAAETRAIVGAGTKISYAADWTEFNTHRAADATGDMYFHLDPLWADANIDFIGIDNYFPLSDWRDGADHADFKASGPTTIYDGAYLEGNVQGGEYYDWYYANAAARTAQARTPITDGLGKPWVFRQKDVANWWANAHFNRPSGVESGTATAWVPRGKPVRFLEMGCPAVDKGANQPNLFPDPKSSEGAFPYFSNQARDDAMQRAYCMALVRHYARPANNPISPVYGGPMLDLGKSHFWCWDARPWPSFALDGSWGDAPNWDTGHWLSGRLGAAPAPETIAAILADSRFTRYAIEPIPAVVDGVTTGTLSSARATLDALRPAYQFDAVESDGVIKFLARQGRAPVATIVLDDLVASEEGGSGWRQTRGQETELPNALKLRYGDPARDDQPASTEARRTVGGSLRTPEMSLPVIMPEAQATALCERELYSAWLGRERTRFALPPSRLALDAGDVINFAPTGRLLRLGGIDDNGPRAVEAFEVDPHSVAPVARQGSPGRTVTPVIYSDAKVVLIDGPLLADGDRDHAGYVAGTIAPFRSGVVLFRSPSETGFVLDSLLPLAATMGVTSGDLYSGPTSRWDRVTSLYLKLDSGALHSASELQVLNGANGLLVENQSGEWELLQYVTATQTGARDWFVTNLLRGQRGTEHAMRSPVPAGTRVIVLNGAVVQTGLPEELVGVTQNWRAGPVDEDIASDRFVGFTRALTAKARRPLSPSQLFGRRNAVTGDWTISWKRRTRVGGDGWEQLDVPLAEASEAYQLDILSPAGAVLRSFAPTAPLQGYTAAQQTADFGAPAFSFTARVRQVSASYGAGIPSQALIWIRSNG